MPESVPKTGTDCTNLFRRAYENRYSWDDDFKGYAGSCFYQKGSIKYQGQFIVTNDLKPKVKDIEDEKISKLISSQLWEVAIHRVKRSFDLVHGENTFTASDINDIGLEILVGGKSKGDKYRIKDNKVTMVYRNIHGSLINIYTKETMETGKGYLSTKYTSQYFDPLSNSPKSGKCFFIDKFMTLGEDGAWVLASRHIEKESFDSSPPCTQKFLFKNLNQLN